MCDWLDHHGWWLYHHYGWPLFNCFNYYYYYCSQLKVGAQMWWINCLLVFTMNEMPPDTRNSIEDKNLDVWAACLSASWSYRYKKVFFFLEFVLHCQWFLFPFTRPTYVWLWRSRTVSFWIFALSEYKILCEMITLLYIFWHFDSNVMSLRLVMVRMVHVELGTVAHTHTCALIKTEIVEWRLRKWGNEFIKMNRKRISKQINCRH